MLTQSAIGALDGQVEGLTQAQARRLLIEGREQEAIEAIENVTNEGTKNELLRTGIEHGAPRFVQYLLRKGCTALVCALDRLLSESVTKEWKKKRQEYGSTLDLLVDKICEQSAPSILGLSAQEVLTKEQLHLAKVCMELLKKIQNPQLTRLIANEHFRGRIEEDLPTLLREAVSFGNGEAACQIIPHMTDAELLLELVRNMNQFLTRFFWKDSSHVLSPDKYEQVHRVLIQQVSKLLSSDLTETYLERFYAVIDYLVVKDVNKLKLLEGLLKNQAIVNHLGDRYADFLEKLSESNPEMFLDLLQKVRLSESQAQVLKNIYQAKMKDSHFAPQMLNIVSTHYPQVMETLANKSVYLTTYERSSTVSSREGDLRNAVSPKAGDHL